MLNFRKYPNLTSVTVPNNVMLSTNNLSFAFRDMRNLVSVNFNHPNVTNMNNTYMSCFNLTGSPVCGDNVTDMSYTYYYCRNLTGSPVCGNNVTSMYMTYMDCYNLTGSPVCGDNVTNMQYTYFNCVNLTGSPVCSNNVTNMNNTYSNCYNLTGSPVCGNNVINMFSTYSNCRNLNEGTSYFYSHNVENANGCFYGKNNSRRYNIHIPANSTTLNTFLINNNNSIVNDNITWTNAGSYYYNSTYNIYIYPVESVEEARLEKEYTTSISFSSDLNKNIDLENNIATIKNTWAYPSTELTIDSGNAFRMNVTISDLTDITITKVEVK